MIKKENIRITITLSKKQNTWLENFCKKHNITKSTYIKLILVKKAKELHQLFKLEQNDEMELENVKNKTDENLNFEDLIKKAINLRKK